MGVQYSRYAGAADDKYADWLTSHDYAEIWHVVPRVVTQYASDGELPAVKLHGKWLFPPGLSRPPAKKKYIADLTESENAARMARRKSRVAEKKAELYKQRKENGICTKCGKRVSEPGKIRCLVCTKSQKRYWREWYADGNEERCKTRYHELRALGLCTTCRRPAIPGQALCKRCREKVCEAQEVKRIEKRIKQENEREVREAKGNG